MNPIDLHAPRDAFESEYRSEGREEVVPNFIIRTPERREETDGRSLTPCAGDENIAAVPDGDEYLIVGSIGNEVYDDSVEVEREPAVRHAVVQGERLWRIPNNWEQYLRVSNDESPDKVVYNIPAPAVDVLVRVPGQDDSDETRYKVEQVGSIGAQMNEEPDRDALRDLIATVEEENDTSEEVLTVLRTLEDQWHNFESDYTGYMNKWGTEAVWGLFKSEDDAVVESWTFDPWDTDQDISGFIPGCRDVDNEVLGRVASRLIDAGVVSPSPAAKVEFRNGEGLPPGYFVQALTEAGCSPTEIVDWLMVKTRGHTESTWSDVRGEHEQKIAENISAAESTFTS